MATFTNQTKNTASFINYLKHANTILNDMANYTFTDVVFDDGTTLQNVRFDQLVDVVWTNVTKSVAPTFTNQIRN